MKSATYIDFVKLYMQSNLVTNESFAQYVTTMCNFFKGVPSDYTNLDYFCNRPNPEPQYEQLITNTQHLSGVNDRRTTPQGNDYWVEETELMGSL